MTTDAQVVILSRKKICKKLKLNNIFNYHEKYNNLTHNILKTK